MIISPLVNLLERVVRVEIEIGNRKSCEGVWGDILYQDAPRWGEGER